MTEPERVLKIRAPREQAERIKQLLNEYEGIDAIDAEIDTETRTSTILPAVYTRRFTYYGEMQIGMWLTFVGKKTEVV